MRQWHDRIHQMGRCLQQRPRRGLLVVQRLLSGDVGSIGGQLCGHRAHVRQTGGAALRKLLAKWGAAVLTWMGNVIHVDDLGCRFHYGIGGEMGVPHSGQLGLILAARWVRRS
jgi:hypothetical protein